MRTVRFNDEKDWLEGRIGKVTGSRLKDIIVKRGNGKKIGFYQLIAERVGIPADGENVMDRGHRLEAEAIERFNKETGKNFIITGGEEKKIVMWVRDDNENIAFSPDAYSEDETEVADAKCLASANHLEAYLTKEVPSEYEEQVVQAFCVNDKLKNFYLVFYDPRMPKDFFYLTIRREDVETKIVAYLEYQRNILAEVDEIVKSLTF